MAKANLAAVAQDDQAYLEDVKRKAMSAMDLLDDNRTYSQVYQDYYDGDQWTPEELQKLKARNQPALTFNHIKPAVNAIIGIVERGKTDPKAWGRTPKDQDAAEIATDGLRYVADTARFNSLKREALQDLLIWGTAISVVEVDQSAEINVRRVKPEEYFYDPYSRDPDFSDARFDGIAKWMDEQDAIALYPDKADVIRQSIEISPSETYKDRPNRAWSWADRKARRVMVFDMYHRRGADWYRCIFVNGGILKSGPSEYKDSKGRLKKCTIAQSAFVDRDNKRYGVIKDMLGPQDAINKGRSKAVHLLNVAKLRVDPGTQDVDAVRREWAKPDGIIEARENQVEELGDKQLTPAHLELLRDAKDEMRRQSPTPGIVGRGGASQSGRAILAEQQAGLTEQAPLLASFDDWVMRNYRAMWDCIKQFWTAPKWVRVTDDEMAPRFMLMNAVDPQTGQPFTDPQTGQPMPPNSPAEMDVDIVLDSTPDTAVIQEEQFQKLAELVQAGIPIPPDVLIEASSLPKKRLLLDKLKQAQEQQQQAPGPEMQEQAKAQVQIQAKQQMAEIDAQAHAAQLAREDQADKAKADRQAALEQQKFQYDMQRLEAQAELDGVKVSAATEADLRKQREAVTIERAKKNLELEHSAAQKEMDFQFKAKERDHIVETERAKGAAVAEAQAPAIDQLHKRFDDMGKALEKLARPKRIVRDPVTGEKRAEYVN